MNRSVTSILFTLLLVSSILEFMVLPTYGTAQVTILTHSGWLDAAGFYHISGEVQNTGENAVELVKVIATFYDSSNIVIGTSSTYTTLGIIPSGRKSPFEILLLYASQAAKVDHYGLNVTYSSSSPLPQMLEIPSNSSFVDTNFMHIVGEIRNIATETATYVKAIATFYNTEGQVVATTSTYSDPSDIESNQKAPFHIMLLYTNRVPLVSTYVLTAESDQYDVKYESSPAAQIFIVAWIPTSPYPLIPISSNIPRQGEPVSVIANVSNADSVVLHYRVNDGEWANISMTFREDTWWNTTIGGQLGNSTVELYVTAIAGNIKESGIDSYVVKPFLLGDINGDGIVDMKDIGITARHFGEH